MKELYNAYLSIKDYACDCVAKGKVYDDKLQRLKREYKNVTGEELKPNEIPRVKEFLQKNGF